MPIAQLDWSLNIECPACSVDNDLAAGDHDTENDIARHIFSNQWDSLKDWEVTCEICGHEFTIEKIEY
jgi:hypothetical protein